MEARQLRGAKIVESGGLQQRGDHMWLVPSQSHSGKWLVDYSSGEPTCTCPDFETTSAFCKHIFAIEIHKGRLLMSTDDIPNTEAERKTYTQDWAAYNAAQMNERAHFTQLLHALCQGIVMPPQTGRGRPRTPLADAVFSCVLKVYEGMSGRRTTSEVVRSRNEGFIEKAVSYNTISDYMSDESITPLLRALLQESASPLAGVEGKFAVDSTGFSTKTYDRWFDEKWGKSKKKAKFVKSHAVCGTWTHVVPDMIVSSAGDATQFVPLLDATGRRFTIESVSADKAYSSKKNVSAAYGMGAVPYIPFRDGVTGKGPELWRRMFHYYQFKREVFDQHYHDRSNIETAFSMVKAKFGAYVRSKSEEGQVNELYCKFICHNVVVLISSIYELGLVPEFWTDGSHLEAPVMAEGA